MAKRETKQEPPASSSLADDLSAAYRVPKDRAEAALATATELAKRPQEFVLAALILGVAGSTPKE